MTSADVSARVAWADDAAAIAAVQVRAWRTTYDDLLPAEVLAALDADQIAEGWRLALGRPEDARNRVLVSLERNLVTGFVVTGPAIDPDCDPVTSGELSKYRYVHFATHGVLDSERPGLSALVLSMVDEQGKPQDGFLRANDIYNLRLPAELVVLSACQTGLGKEIKGEGLVGLTRGFMYAGAARVVVSLWSVNDKATADLMTRFYQKMLKQGERPAAALRSAQVEMWKQKQWQSPYYWAAFTLQGEWR